MRETLDRIKHIVAEGCVTLTLNTHRTLPDNQKDPIVLKNLITEAENRLKDQLDKKKVTLIVKNLRDLSEQIDHSHNLDSLVVFANDVMAEFVRLPVKVVNRLIIDQNFATRDLIRALNRSTSYYILVISRRNARLIEAFNDKLIQEITDDFPIQNQDLVTNDKLKLSMSQGQERLYEEFFNRVDKVLQSYVVKNAYPVILASEERNFHHFLKVSGGNIAGHINRNRDEEKANHIVADAWPVMKSAILEMKKAELSHLQKAIDEQKYLSDISDIWQAVNDGRGDILFVRHDLIQAARISGRTVELVNKTQTNGAEVIDDIVDEIIEINSKKGGRVVFVDTDAIAKYNHMVLTTRY